MDYKFFLIPIIVMIITQVVKVIIETIKDGEFNWQRINGYGGMPSSHSAMVTSLAITVGYYQGVSSPIFAVAIIVALLTIRDAYGFREQLGHHGKILNKLIKELPDEKEYKFPILKETFGHKTIEVIVGIIFGIVLSLLFIQILL